MSIRQGNKIIAGNVDNTDYTALLNKPQINSIELSGNKTLEELGIQASGDYATNEYVNTELDKKLNTNQITNCITKIPQDIKIETSDTVLTLKSGSKPYKADSSFFTVSSDVTLDIASVATEYLLVYGEDNTIKAVPPSLSFSQDTEPSNSSYLWYNTTTKEVKFKADSGDIIVCSLPIAIIYSDKTIETFNGFGYIGSTIFALPGVEGLIPNGRNADGSLNNIKFTIDSLKTLDISDYVALNKDIDLVFGYYSGFASKYATQDFNRFTKDKIATSNAYTHSYVNSENQWYFYNKANTTWSEQYVLIFARFYLTADGNINLFTPKISFQAVNRSDTEWASTQSMPSNRYIDLTWGATGTSYIAPANGWFTCQNVAGTANTGVRFSNVTVGSMGASCISATIEGTCAVTVPAKKGDRVILYYNTTGTALKILRFIYAEGEN